MVSVKICCSMSKQVFVVHSVVKITMCACKWIEIKIDSINLHTVLVYPIQWIDTDVWPMFIPQKHFWTQNTSDSAGNTMMVKTLLWPRNQNNYWVFFHNVCMEWQRKRKYLHDIFWGYTVHTSWIAFQLSVADQTLKK